MVGVGKGKDVPVFKQLWPDIKVVGIEPLTQYIEMNKDFPGQLVQCAVGPSPGKRELYHAYNRDQRASFYDIPGLPNELFDLVDVRTLDDIEATTGPWCDAIMWLDIEGAEVEAMQNSQVMSSGKVRWVNVELTFLPQKRRAAMAYETDDMLRSLGFIQCGITGIARDGMQADALYLRREEWIDRRRVATLHSVKRKIRRWGRKYGVTADDIEDDPWFAT
jgi:FkbM family methyltransferase